MLFLVLPEGRVRFDSGSDDGVARQVPAEAHRRFRADLRMRADQRREAHAAHVANYEEKNRVAAEWIAAHGTLEQQARQAAGVLPMAQVVDLTTAEIFRPLEPWPTYPLDGTERLQARLREHPQYARAMLTLHDLVITMKEPSPPPTRNRRSCKRSNRRYPVRW